MKVDERHFTLDELCTLVEQPKRRIRFYIQKGLVDRPCGSNRGSYYTHRHLQQLLTIRKWQKAGLSLERIRELMNDENDADCVPIPKPKPGSLKVWSHILLAQGVELHIEPEQSGLTPEQVREISREVIDIFSRIVMKREE